MTNQKFAFIILVKSEIIKAFIKFIKMIFAKGFMSISLAPNMRVETFYESNLNFELMMLFCALLAPVDLHNSILKQ